MLWYTATTGRTKRVNYHTPIQLHTRFLYAAIPHVSFHRYIYIHPMNLYCGICPTDTDVSDFTAVADKSEIIL